MTAPNPKVIARPSAAIAKQTEERSADPCTMIIMGAGGDLTRRKLLPAIYGLAHDSLLPQTFAILGVGRDPGDDAFFRGKMHDALAESDEVKNLDEDAWKRLSDSMYYVVGDLTSPDLYAGIKQRLEQIEAKLPEKDRNRIFYLAIPPSLFPTVVKQLCDSGLSPKQPDSTERPWRRVVIEKPFGRSLETALQLNAIVLNAFAEHQVYRIDHYLGKETVQNLLVFRFANTIFEPLWNRIYISHVEITAAETVGVEGRGGYYEEAGVLRDMFQNHLLQLLSLTAMEPPVAMTANAVRDEKVKVLCAVRRFNERTPDSAVRAQYAAGRIGVEQVPGYRQEPSVKPDSLTPTYAAVRLFVDNWRWDGVPFYLRSGKRLAKRTSEVAIHFREPPHLMFRGESAQQIMPNVLVIRVQPNEGIALRFEVKVPGAERALTPALEMSSVDMDFSYASAFGETSPPAYETLLLDVMLGDATLFTRSDEVEGAWHVIDPLITYWENNKPEWLPLYEAGSWGPSEADQLLRGDGFRWRKP